MNLDEPLCLCFQVSRRKLIRFIEVNRIRVASQLSECGGAGTGCGWCIPYLKQLYSQLQEGTTNPLDQLSSAEYQINRQKYIAQGGGSPTPNQESRTDDDLG